MSTHTLRSSMSSFSALEKDSAVERVVAKYRTKYNKEAPRKPLYSDQVLLMQRRVTKMLLIASLYDAYMFEEDGGLSEALLSEYQRLNFLNTPPQIVRASTTEEALDLLKNTPPEAPFHLVIFLLRVESHGMFRFLSSVKQLAPRLPVLLLASNQRELATLDPRVDEAYRINIHKRIGWENSDNSFNALWSWPFLWQGDVALLMAMIKSVEDRLNCKHDFTRGNIHSIILLEDNVQYYSSFLPMLYKELVILSHNTIENGLTRQQQVFAVRSRPKILLANTYEEAMELYETCGGADGLLAIITDVGFPKNGIHDNLAGITLVEEIRKKHPHLPILIQSTQRSNELHASRLSATFLCKTDPKLLSKLRDFLLDDVGFGPLKFSSEFTTQFVSESESEPEQILVENLKELELNLPKISTHSLHETLVSDKLSIWLAARAEFGLAKATKSLKNTEETDLRFGIQDLINLKRANSRAGIVAYFHNSTFDANSQFSKVGTGSLGGKGRGLSFIHSLLNNHHVNDLFTHLRIFVPRTLVLATGVFDQFMEDGDLHELALSDEITDEQLTNAFLNAQIPDTVLESLNLFLDHVNFPIAVRSSSLFEDAIVKPFAGIYRTIMLPNNSPDKRVRASELYRAIKLVYASTFQREAKTYSLASGNRIEEEKMAVVIQELIGETDQHRNVIFPSFAGVARSYDFYPKFGLDPSSGVCSLALGLGGTVVDGGNCARFSPTDPSRTFFEVNQTHLLALCLERPEDDDHLINNLIRIPLNEKEKQFQIFGSWLNSTFPSSIEVLSKQKRWMIKDVHGETTFVTIDKPHEEPDRNQSSETCSLNDIIKQNKIPISDAMLLLMEMCSVGMACPVELEFAVILPKTPDRLPEFAVLQIRPMVKMALSAHINVEILPSLDYAICNSVEALGHGFISDVRDIVFVNRKDFDPTTTQAIANDVGTITQVLHQEQRSYLLIGPGRWGTATPEFGIPVSWAQIRGSACIIETDIIEASVPPSQGTHFFQNITSFGVGYFTVDLTSDIGSELNFDWLEEQTFTNQVGKVKHIQFDKPLEIVIDGRTRCGTVMKPGASFHEVVEQMNAFLDLENIPSGY